MEINVDQGKLAKALSVVSRVATGSKTTLPILSNVLIRVLDGKVTLTTTNLDMAVVDYLPTSSSKNGEITVPARLLADFVSNLPKGDVKISVKDTKITTVSGKYKSVMNGVDATDFPELPELNEEKSVIFKIPAEEFKESVSSVKVAVSNDTTRPAFTGVYFNTDENNLYAVGCDGYRLAVKKLVSGISSEIKAIVPIGAINEVLASISEETEEVEILFDESQVCFKLGEIEITSKYIDSSFPDYKVLIPEQTNVEFSVLKSEILRVTKLAALFAREVGGSIILETDANRGVLLVSSVANEFGENTSEIEVDVEKSEKVIVNSRYILDTLGALSGESIKIGFSGGVMPVKMTNMDGADCVHIVMPLKG
jgi:DNA polymerase-3 subunit beta